jgi:hypothetical protein
MQSDSFRQASSPSLHAGSREPRLASSPRCPASQRYGRLRRGAPSGLRQRKRGFMPRIQQAAFHNRSGALSAAGAPKRFAIASLRSASPWNCVQGCRRTTTLGWGPDSRLRCMTGSRFLGGRRPAAFPTARAEDRPRRRTSCSAVRALSHGSLSASSRVRVEDITGHLGRSCRCAPRPATAAPAAAAPAPTAP